MDTKTLDLRCKKRIVEWIMANQGYAYSLFTFVPQYEDEVLPTAEEFEANLYVLDDWVKLEEADLNENEKEMYPSSHKRYKYGFKPLQDALKAHLFTDDSCVLYVVITT